MINSESLKTAEYVIAYILSLKCTREAPLSYIVQATNMIDLLDLHYWIEDEIKLKQEYYVPCPLCDRKPLLIPEKYILDKKFGFINVAIKKVLEIENIFSISKKHKSVSYNSWETFKEPWHISEYHLKEIRKVIVYIDYLQNV